MIKRRLVRRYLTRFTIFSSPHSTLYPKGDPFESFFWPLRALSRKTKNFRFPSRH